MLLVNFCVSLPLKDRETGKKGSGNGNCLKKQRGETKLNLHSTPFDEMKDQH